MADDPENIAQTHRVTLVEESQQIGAQRNTFELFSTSSYDRESFTTNESLDCEFKETKMGRSRDRSSDGSKYLQAN